MLRPPQTKQHTQHITKQPSYPHFYISSPITFLKLDSCYFRLHDYMQLVIIICNKLSCF